MPKTTNPEPLTTDDLEARAQQAFAEAARLSDEAHAARMREAQERQNRLDAFDREQLAQFDPAERQATLDAARARLRDAILADPVWSAALEVYAVQLGWRHRVTELRSVAETLGERFVGGLASGRTAPGCG